MNKIHKRTFQRDGTIHSGSVQLSGTSQLALCPLLVFLLSLLLFCRLSFRFARLFLAGFQRGHTSVQKKEAVREGRDVAVTEPKPRRNNRTSRRRSVRPCSRVQTLLCGLLRCHDG